MPICPVNACPVCSGAKPETIAALSKIIVRKQFKPGDHLIQAGDPADGFYAIQDGLARVYRSSTEGKDVSLVVLEPGSTYGETCLFGVGEFTENVFVLKAMTAYWIPKREFLAILASDAELGVSLAKGLSRLLKKLIGAVNQNSSLQAPERVAQFLGSLRKNGNLSVVELPLTKKEIAAQLSMSPETFSRALRKLESDELIKVRQRTVTIAPYFDSFYS